MRNAIVRKVVATSFAAAILVGGGSTVAVASTHQPTTVTASAGQRHGSDRWEYNRGFRDGFRDGFRAGCEHHKGIRSQQRGGFDAYGHGYERGFDRGFLLGEHRCHHDAWE